MREVIDALFRHAESSPDRLAVVTEDAQIGYGALARKVIAMAAALSQAPRIVASMMPRTADWIATDLALAMLGRTVVPLPEFFSPGQLSHVLADSGAGAVIATHETVGRAASLGWPVLIPHPADGGRRPARGGSRRIIYTSGTTGCPKGVVLGECQLSASLTGLAQAVNPSPDDRHLSVLPFSLLLEQVCGLYLPLLSGAAIFLCPDPQRLPAAAEWWRPTTTVLVPE
ncbi:MAG TPA: AMP-binding protein, partial [Candidatus Omnitrophota bacterium]|nr:AMP-binding protein [Candidatus Omnitrophota bacterium]